MATSSNHQSMLSIIICTYNRTTILSKTLASLAEVRSVDNIECLLINNNTDTIADEVRLIAKNYPGFRLIHEPKTGLSYARNTGYSEARGEWLIFLDDDVQLPHDFLDKALEVIVSDQFDCFGGMYYPWHLSTKPEWLSESFGQKIPLRNTTGKITPGIEGYLSAGIFAIKKSILEKAGGFRTDLGMNAKMGYGEEDALQIRLHELGYRMGFVPDWWMKHAVLPHKYSLKWHLRSAYARARDAHFIKGNTAAATTLMKIFGSITAAAFKRLPLSVWKLLTQKEYYWQNAVLDTMTPIVAYVGRFNGIKKYTEHKPG